MFDTKCMTFFTSTSVTNNTVTMTMTMTMTMGRYISNISIYLTRHHHLEDHSKTITPAVKVVGELIDFLETENCK